MKLQVLSIVSVLGFVAGCTGGIAGNAAGVGEATADVRLDTSLAKRRDHHPAKTPLERLKAPTLAAARLAGAPSPVLPQAVASATQPALTYRGGPVMQSPQIYAVFWGPSVNPNVVSGVPGFFGGVTAAASPINTMLAQYNTNGMTIGTGTYSGSIADDDAPMPASGVITDAMIEAEGARLVDSGKVPAENGHNILMFFFPPGIAIDQGGGTMSCQVFCAYHSTFTRNGNNFFYGVIPDQNSGGCEQGCGLTTDQVNTTYSTSSHELIEAITDAAVGVGDLAWYDNTFGEIGDVCIEWDGTSNGYHVQSEWSNADKGCVDHTATTHAAIDVKYDDTVATAPAASATYAITSSGTATGQMTLSTADLFTGNGGFTASFSPATIAVGGSSTLTVGVPTGLRSQDATFKVVATDANGANHFAQVSLHVKGAAPTITSATPATGPSQGGTVVNLVGTNFGPGAYAKICSSSTTTCSTVTSAGNGVIANGGYISGSSGTKFQLVMPSHTATASTGTTVKIWVYNANDTANPAKISYKYTTGAAPTVTSVDPATGPVAGGTFVTITGTNFSSAVTPAGNSTIKLGAATLDCDPASQTQNCAILDDKTAIAITPAATAAGKVAVTVTNIDTLTGTMANAFQYGINAPPSVDSLSVDNGPTAGGTYVTIFGNNLDATATVTFGGTAAMVKTSNPSFLGVFSPAHAAGAVDVVVANGDAQTAKTTFTYADGTGGSGGTGGGNDDGGTDDGGGTGGGGTGGSGGGGDGTGGTGGTGGGGAGGGNGAAGGNHIDNSSGCSMGGDGSSAPSILSLLVVLGAFGFALRRQRS
jgi:MYXO-CTERM domain-containing protein